MPAGEARAPRFPLGLAWAVGLSWRFLVVAAAAGLAAFLLLQLRLVVVPAVAALLLSTLFVPPVAWLRRHRWPPLLATWAVLLAAATALAGVVVLIVPRVGDELDDTGRAVQEGLRRIKDWLVEGPLGLSREDIDRYVNLLADNVRDNASTITSGLASGAYLAVEVVAGILLVLVFTFFFVKDGDRICSWALRHLDEDHRQLARALARRVWETAAAYVRGMAVVAAVDAAVIGLGLAVIGVPLVLPLAALTFVGAFLPLVGAVAAGAVAALVALVTAGAGAALLVVALVVVVQQVEGDVLAPLVMGRALKLHPLVIIVALTAGAVTAGVLGAFFAVPVTAVAVAVGNELRSQRADGTGPPAPVGVEATT